MAEMLTNADGQPLLLPTPRMMRRVSLQRVRVGDEAVRWARAMIAAAPEPGESAAGTSAIAGVRIEFADDLDGDDAYRLRVSLQGVVIGARARAGVRYGLATLVQLARVCAGMVPELEIEDAPDFAIRGVMLDISRDRVPTMEHFKQIVDQLAELKYNHLQLYTEHTFAYAGHEEVWRDASPITPDEARELDAYCMARGIELTPNQNCFGHLATWLKRERYQPVSEIEGDGVWKFLHFERRGAFSLNPTHPGSASFVADLLGQLLPCFQSRLVNIGCDETFDVGWGRSKAEVERRAALSGFHAGTPEHDKAMSRARAEVYFEFVAEIARICRGHGRTPMMWADIALSHPELLSMMPKEMIGLAWWYEPTEKFASWVRVLKESGHRAWVCPGTSSWRSFTGRSTERRGNLADAAEQGLADGAEGFLVCDWGDLGHRQTWPISLMGIAHGAEAAWNVRRAREFDARAAGVHAFGDASGDAGVWLEKLGDADLHIRSRIRLTNATAIFNDLHPPVPGALKPGERCIDASAEEWGRALETLRELAGRVPSSVDELTRREMEHSVDVAMFAAEHAMAHRQSEGLRDSARAELRERAEEVTREHEELWSKRSRSGGLGHASSYYRSVIDALG
jgi:hypothetical protein